MGALNSPRSSSATNIKTQNRGFGYASFDQLFGIFLFRPVAWKVGENGGVKKKWRGGLARGEMEGRMSKGWVE